MRKVIIRKAELRDAEALCCLNQKDLGYDFELEKTKQNISEILRKEDNCIWVACADEYIAGYIHVQLYQAIYAPRMINIMGIAVSKEYQRCGIGRMLLIEAENWARKRNAAGIRLVSGTGRSGAHVFYERCGYGQKRTQYNFKKMLD